MTRRESEGHDSARHENDALRTGAKQHVGARKMDLQTVKFNTVQGIALGAAAGVLMWAGIIGAVLAILR